MILFRRVCIKSETRLLTLPCLSVCMLYVSTNQRSFHWSDLREIWGWTFKKICWETPNVVKIGRQYWAFQMKTQLNLYCVYRIGKQIHKLWPGFFRRVATSRGKHLLAFSCLCARPSFCLFTFVDIHERCSHRTHLREIRYWGFLRKFLEKFKISLKWDKNIRPYTWGSKWVSRCWHGKQ
jgi:hypothetical protein